MSLDPHLIILFAVIPLAAGVLTLLLKGRVLAQRVVGFLACCATLGLSIWAIASLYAGPDQAGGVLVSQMGNWLAPFGVTVAVDLLAGSMLLGASLVSLAVLVYSFDGLPRPLEQTYYHPLFHLLMLGINWSFITGDLFNLFVAFELMLMAAYGLFTLGTSKAQMRQAYKYTLLNLLASMLFLSGCGLVYGHCGTLNFADLARQSITGALPQGALPAVGVLLIAFGAKTAIFPLWFWLPSTYPTLPTSVVALFAGLMTKVGAYVLVRVFVMVFGAAVTLDEAGDVAGYPVSEAIWPLLAVSAGVTMFVGVLGAVSRSTVKGILSIHIISQVGYMAMGAALGLAAFLEPQWRVMAVAGAVFFIVHNMVVKCALFLCGGLMQAHAGSDHLEKIGGLVRRAPWAAVLFFIAAMSLAGLPPLSGFFGKFVLVRAGLLAGEAHGGFYWLTGFAIATSLLTLLSMLKIWSYGFWSPTPEDAPSRKQPNAYPRVPAAISGAAILVVAALGLGLGAQPCLDVSQAAARSLVDPRPYVRAVLGESAAESIARARPDLPAPSPPTVPVRLADQGAER